MIQQPNELVQSSTKQDKSIDGQAKSVWVIIATAIITASLVGCGVYWWQSSKLKRTRNNMAKTQQLLQQQVRDLRDQIESLRQEREQPTTDSRILLTPENIEQYSPNCEEKFNSDPADMTVTYSSQARGISLEIPYSSKWGSDKYRINPYDEGKDHLAFGFIGAFEACGWARSYFLFFLPAKSSDDVISDLKKGSNYPDLFSLKPEKIIIDNLEVVKYEDTGLCSYPTLHVIGRKYNYELRPLCGMESRKEFQYLEGIVKTIKLID